MRVVVSGLRARGEHILVEFTNEANTGGPPPHWHPRQSETYRVLEGQLHVRIGSRTHLLLAGDELTVPPKAVHTFWNEGDEPVRFTSHHRPAGRFEQFITSMYDLDYDGLCTARGLPKNPLQMAVLARSVREENVLAWPPRWVQRVVFGTLGALGARLGFDASYRSAHRRSRGAATPSAGSARL